VKFMSLQFFYSVWTRTSTTALVLWGLSFVADDTWFVKTALTVILALLLVTGILLLGLGLRDLARDFRHMLHKRLHKRSHA
jgi:hypothetical protein